MKFLYTFKHLDHSEALVNYAMGRVQKVYKFELKPMTVNLAFSAQKHERVVEILMKGPDLRLKATGKAEDLYDAVDDAVDKICKQMAKNKSKVQYHKRPEFSAEGTMEIMSESLDHDYAKLVGDKRKTG